MQIRYVEIIERWKTIYRLFQHPSNTLYMLYRKWLSSQSPEPIKLTSLNSLTYDAQDHPIRHRLSVVLRDLLDTVLRG